MKNLRFDRLVIVSHTSNSARQLRFQKRFNLVTAKDNGVGKSSLVKSIFWALGCSPRFDTNWKSLNCEVLLEFSIDNENYKVGRRNNSICLEKPDGRVISFPKITGEFSSIISDTFNFKVKLPNRDTDQLEVPPPSYYFLPFYIDQIEGWKSLWSSFHGLGQYAQWQNAIVKYHTGYTTSEYFDLEDEIYEYKLKSTEELNDINKIDSAMEIVERYLPKEDIALDNDELKDIIKYLEDDLCNLSNLQKNYLSKINSFSNEKYTLEIQLKIARQVADEIEKDYLFAVEKIEGDELECPTCGTIHDNSLLSRASILSDKRAAENQVNIIEKEICKIDDQIKEITPELNNIKEEIIRIRGKYKEKNKNLKELVSGMASGSVQRKVRKVKLEKQVKINDYNEISKNIKKEQGMLLSKDAKKDIDNYFLTTFAYFLRELKANSVDISTIRNPLNYKKVENAGGGAAEVIRAILAYQLAVYKQIRKFGSEVLSPLVVDTPNQQDQTGLNYENMIELLMATPSDNSQMIICAVDNSSMLKYKDVAHIIDLDERKILLKEEYYILSDMVTNLFNIADNVSDN